MIVSSIEFENVGAKDEPLITNVKSLDEFSHKNTDPVPISRSLLSSFSRLDEISTLIGSFGQNPKHDFQLDTEIVKANLINLVQNSSAERYLSGFDLEALEVVSKPIPKDPNEAFHDVYVVSNGGERDTSIGGADKYTNGLRFSFVVESWHNQKYGDQSLSLNQWQELANLTSFPEYRHYYRYILDFLQSTYEDPFLVFKAQDVIMANVKSMISALVGRLELGDDAGAQKIAKFTRLPLKGILPMVIKYPREFLIWREF